MFGFLAALLVMAGLTGAAMAQSNYLVQPGDTLQVEVLEDSNLNRHVLVLPDGSISFPMTGSVQAGGRSVDAVAQTLAAGMASNFAVEPTVLVSVAALAPKAPRVAARPDLINVYIIGEVAAPGRMEVSPGTTLIQFLAEAGGLSKFAAEKRIELHRTDSSTGKVTTYLFNYRTPGGSSTGINGGTRLAPGDVIKVPQRKLFE